MFTKIFYAKNTLKYDTLFFHLGNHKKYIIFTTTNIITKKNMIFSLYLDMPFLLRSFKNNIYKKKS